MSDLPEYRRVMQSIMVQNIIAMGQDKRWPESDRAGTVLMALTAAIGASSAIWQKANPHLSNAPIEAVVRDLLDLVADVLCQPKQPLLSIVPEVKP
jgi:hypothetical protein